MMQPIYLLIGSPGSGKSWITSQLKDKFHFLANDDFMDKKGPKYIDVILRHAPHAKRPLLIEAPFSISQIMDPLKESGYTVIPCVIIESESTLRDRYFSREKKEIPKSHIARMATYQSRAKEYGWFHGTSAEVLKHLNTAVQ